MTGPTAADDQPGKRAYKVPEAAKILGITPDQMRHLCRRGKIRSRNTGAAYIIPASAIDEYLAGADEPIASAS
jgi:excisionase family DNA binding protein